MFWELNALRKKKDATLDDVIRVEKMISIIYSKIDKAVRVGVIHKNAASHRKSRLARRKKALLLFRGWYTAAPEKPAPLSAWFWFYCVEYSFVPGKDLMEKCFKLSVLSSAQFFWLNYLTINVQTFTHFVHFTFKIRFLESSISRSQIPFYEDNSKHDFFSMIIFQKHFNISALL